MTSRGNPSISPPAQIPQQRHGNAIPSGTPPPQQFYPGQSPALQQGGFEFIAPQQPLLSYQAYGSAVNDVRNQPGNGVRGAPPQQGAPAMHQGAAAYYPPAGANIRPQQQPNAVNQQYFISQQNNMRPRHPNQSQGYVYLPQNFAGNNVIVTPNMYQPRAPLNTAYYAPVPQSAYQTVYITNGAGAQWRAPAIQQQPQGAQPVAQQPRVKKLLRIEDPNTGKDVIEELLHNTASHAHQEHPEQPEDEAAAQANPSGPDVRLLFTQKVAAAMQQTASEEGASSAAAGPVDSQVTNMPPPYAPHQFQQPPGPPPTMMGGGPPRMPPPTHIRPPHMMGQPQAGAPQPGDMHSHQRINLNRPPPTIPTFRQPTPAQVYNTAQQHAVRHPPPQAVPRQPLTLVAPSAVEPARPAQTEPATTPQAAPVEPEPQSVQAEADSTTADSTDGSAQPEPPVQEPVKEQTPPAEPAKPAENKDEVSQGAGNKGAKDGRGKGKKNKRDLNTKEIGGSDMDAFIDARKGTKLSSPNGDIAHSNASLNNATSSESATVTQEVRQQAPTLVNGASAQVASPPSSSSSPTEELATAAENGCEDAAQAQGDCKDEELEQIADKQNVLQKQQVAAGQQDSKHKLKKRKKKKGRKTPPLSKSKQGAMPSGVPEEKENEVSPSTENGKPPVPPAGSGATEQPSASAEKVVESGATTVPAQAEPATPPTPVNTSTPAVQEKMVEKPSESSVPASKPTEEEKASDVTPSEPPKEIKKEAAASSAPAASKTQNQPATEENSVPTPKPATETNVKASLNGGESKDSPSGATVPAPSTAPAPPTPVNDENVPPPQDSSDKAPAAPPSKENNTAQDAAGKKEGKDKLQYDRAYLIKLRGCESSQTKPEGLPNLEIILDRPMSQMTRGASGTSPDFLPNFFQQGTPQRHSQSMGKRGRPGEMQMPQRIIKSVSIQNDVKALHQSEKPWKPTPKQLATGEIASKTEDLEKKSLFIMNRLTPTNFEALSTEMMNLKVDTYESLQQLVKIIFDKVTLETKFVEAYAQLCKKMCSKRVPTPPGIKETQGSFRVLLLTKCQTEFESDKAEVFEDPEEKRQKLEAEMPDEADKKDKIDTILYHMKLRRLKFYGNIRFIGELFKLGLLTENIMHDCIFRLLKARDDESLLSLCQLVTTVGSLLDTSKAKSRMDQYFHQMTKIAEERKSRIKFTLKDAIELRQNHWVPRKETTGPKKIDEVRQDFHKEQQTKQFLQNQPPPPRPDLQPGSRRGSRQRQDEKPVPTDDGWNTVGVKSMKVDASKMKITRQNISDGDNIQLGPGGGMNRFAMWGKGSGASQPSMDSPNRPSNRYSALTSEEDRRFQRSPNRGDSVVNRGLRQGNTAGHGRGKINSRSSVEGERRDVLNSARSIVGGRSQNSSRDNSWNRDDRRSFGPRGSREGDSSMGPPRLTLRPSAERPRPPAAAPPAPAAPAVVPGYGTVKRAAPKTEEEMEHSAKTIMDEYLNIRDLKEAKLCVMELEGQTYLHSFITASINNVLERSDKERIGTGQFFYEIVKDNLISVDKFVKGLSGVVEFAEDMVIDIPKMWTNLAQMMTPTLAGGCMTWSQLQSVMKQYLSQMCSAKLVAEILLFAKSSTSEADAASMWQKGGLTWDQLMPADQVADFIKDKKLDFLQNPSSASGAANSTASPSSSVNHDRLVADMTRVIRDAKDNSEIFAFIKDNVPSNIDDKLFVRLLMTSVGEASLQANTKFNPELITSRQEVLQKYIKGSDSELQALYAIQALMHRLEHPRGVVAALLEALYTEEVINDAALKTWEHSKEEPEGKGACLLQLTHFFTWLRENEEIEAS